MEHDKHDDQLSKLQAPPPKVLVIDDDEHFLKLVKKVLENHKMNVFTARNVAEAREEIKKVKPEIIVSDLRMPGIKGDEFMRELQSDPVTTDIPFIFVSADRDPGARVSTFANGATDFLTKPIYMDELVARINALVRKNRTVRIQLFTDALTGVKNRWYFEDELPRLLNQAKRHKWQISLVVIDINDFKQINDNYSHLVGDIVLNSLAKELKDQMRTSDIVIRYGGDEFVLVLPETTKAESIMALKRLFKRFENFVLIPVPDRPLKVTISVGLATFPDDASNVEELFARADEAAYVVKKDDKNGFAVAGKQIEKFYY